MHAQCLQTHAGLPKVTVLEFGGLQAANVMYTAHCDVQGGARWEMGTVRCTMAGQTGARSSNVVGVANNKCTTEGTAVSPPAWPPTDNIHTLSNCRFGGCPAVASDILHGTWVVGGEQTVRESSTI